MKTFLASLVAVALLSATASYAATPVHDDVKYTYTFAGQHYKYKHYGHYYNHRSCQQRHLRKTCKYW